MSFVAKLALPLLLLAACGKDPVAPPSPGANTPPETPTQVQDPNPVQPASGSTADPAREPVREDITANSAANKSAPQGVKGRALLPDGQPAVGVPVMLLENAMNDPLEMFLENKSGKTSPPIARDVTAEDGSFYLGVPKAMQKVDLRILSDDHPELSKSPIQVSAGDWYDAGDLKFEVGLTVQGRVVNAQTKGPIAGATVFLSSSVRAHSMVVTPGRERGVAAVTDQSGYFRFTNAPKIGTVNLTAEAEGYASTNKLNQQIRADSPNDFTLEIEAGSTISGVVVDPNGKRVAGAKIMAFGLSVKTPQNETVLSDDNGEFRFPALRSGPYRLTTSARSFADEELAVALTGEDVKVVLQPRARVRLKVLTSKQRPVKSYRLSLKRAFPQNPDAIGNVLDFADRNISPRDYDGAWAVIGDMPTGDFKFQIMEKGHAKSLSPMFKVVQGSEEPVEVVVELTQGATITGRVVDNYGQPVAGARVSSDMNAGLAAGTGLFDIFRSNISNINFKKSSFWCSDNTISHHCIFKHCKLSPNTTGRLQNRSSIWSMLIIS